MPKKVLIIGNGFDLAHGLPTRYSDFLQFAYEFKRIYELESTATGFDYNNNELKRLALSEYLKNELIGLFAARTVTHDGVHLGKGILDRMYLDLKNNIWLYYFWNIYKERIIKGENWIDFESEISDVIQTIDKYSEDLNSPVGVICEKVLQSPANDRRIQLFSKVVENERKDLLSGNVSIRTFTNTLFENLRSLTEALEIYLSCFIETIDLKPISAISEFHPDYVLSFNYTHTFQRLYDKKVPCCYIHGECRNLAPTGSYFEGQNNCNLVLGIDEYLDKSRQDTNNRFVIFKKFVQRIINHNSTDYRSWNKVIENEYLRSKEMGSKAKGYIKVPKSDVFLYGHSLDITDRDILQLYLKPEWSQIHIYAYDENAEGALIENLIKIISERTVIDKASDNPPRLEIHRNQQI